MVYFCWYKESPLGASVKKKAGYMRIAIWKLNIAWMSNERAVEMIRNEVCPALVCGKNGCKGYE